MVVSGISIWLVLLWAVFATIFYRIRYRKEKLFKNPWTMIAIFAVNFLFFAFGAILFILIEWLRYTPKRK